ncbi:MAG: cell surface protein SprA [Ignavibacteriae bacterium]|nr:cell surface protein SprA [Ignavibacteriota bacterium]MCB9243415.1 cell surface protein SprA [Ignavibacteriales bacterium]
MKSHSKYILSKSRLIKYFFGLTIILNLFALSNVSFSQGRRDWDILHGNQYTPGDTGTSTDTTLVTTIDSSKILIIDSTAAERYFPYEPEYSYGVKVNQWKHPLLLGDASQINYTVTFDSTGNVILRKQIDGEDVQVPRVISFNDYINELAVEQDKTLFQEIVAENFKGQTQDDLSQFFEKFTDITIPLPFKSETIFGPPTINLRINGNIDITASYEKIQSDQELVSTTNTSQNNINFKQQVYVTAKGTVGDKLTIDADWNTERVFDFENQLKIKYEGYPDEVIKKIEAGNVSLETNSGLIQSTQALFGIKGEFQLGPLSLTTVVSQKKSKQEEKDYVGGAQQQDFQIPAWDYSDNHFLFDTLYKKSFLDYFNTSTGVISSYTDSNTIVTQPETVLEVWVQTDNTWSNKRIAVAHTMLYEQPTGGYSDTLTTPGTVLGLKFSGYFRKLEPSEYYINPYAGFISLKINVPENYHIGVAYSTQYKKYGTTSTDRPNYTDTLILKMIKVKDQSPDQTPLAWELKLKNIYRLPVSRIIEDGFKFQAMYLEDNILTPNIAGLTSSLSTILRIDRYTGKQKSPPADGIFDYFPGTTINTETGDIIFPTLRPFWDNIDSVLAGTGDSAFVFSDIYTKRKTQVSQNSPLASRYFLVGSAKGEAGISNIINLGFNVVQGSVKLFLGAQELANNIDYSVDYSTGTVTIKNASALVSNDLKIKYETNDLFQLASKTLIGARGVYKLGEESALGFTFVNLKQETLNDKVRLGEEPTNNSMFGLDFSTNIKSKWLTNVVNMLPGFNTKDESSFTLKGEFAYLLPDPNTKRSKIPSDNNEPIAYVDDMEGAKKIITLGTNYSAWTLASLPLDSAIKLPNDSNQVGQSKRGFFRWYNVPNSVSIKDVYPLKDVQPGQETITPLDVTFDPTSRGQYNYYANKFDSIKNTTPTQIWGGMMRYLNTTSTDLISENINFIEFNMQIDDSLFYNQIRPGKLVIELGTISEDAIPNGIFDTEDQNQNGVLDTAEDIGLDYKKNDEELAIYNSINGTSLTLADFPNGDPAKDDNNSSGVIDYGIINGTQNNRLFEGGNRPDTEDLDKSGNWESYSAYFQYEISLDTTNNPNITGRGAPGTGWFQYRIGLSEFVNLFNNPSFTNIEYARVWISGVEEPVTVRLVDFNLTGNQWFKTNKLDTTYSISVVSIEENPQIYESPVPGNVLRQEIRNTSGANTLSNEQSLSLNFNNMQNGQRKMAVKDFRTVPLDLFNYKTLKLFVNGDPSFNYTDENIFDAWMVVRMGTDSNNYYEYRAPIHPDVRPGSPWDSQNEVTINFSDLTAIKIAQDTTSFSDSLFAVPNGPPGSFYRVKGNPTITSIREMALGVEKNRNSYNATITGSVWFNEIRVLNVDDDPGYAYTVTAGVNLANLLAINFSLGKTSPNFYNLDGRFGTRQTGLNWDVSATLNMHKFFNNFFANWFSEEWSNFLTLPLTFRHTERIIDPKYYPGTDIAIDNAMQERYNQVYNQTGNEQEATTASNNLKIESQTLEVRNEFGVNGMKFTFPGNNYLLKNIVNRFELSFNGSIGTYRDVTYENRENFAYNGGVNFKPDFALGDDYHLSIGKWLNLGDDYKDAKLYFALPFLPLAPLFSNNFAGSIDFNRTREESKQRSLNTMNPISRVFDAHRGFNFDWKFIEGWIVDLSGNYSYRVGSDLRPFETNNDSLSTQRPESEVLSSIFFNDALINFGRDLDYAQTTSFNPRFNIPFIKKFLDLTASYNVTYGWRNPNVQDNAVGYNVQFSNNASTTANFKLNELFSLISGSETNKSRGSIGGNNDDREGQNILDVFKLFKGFIPDAVSVTFNQTNTRINPAIQGRPGFGNFWFSFGSDESAGPSRAYQLGLSGDPGKRIPNLSNVQDQFQLANNIVFSTTIKPIFPDAIRMNLSFKKRWGFTNTNTYTTNNEGLLSFQTNKSNSVNNAYSIFFFPDAEDFKYLVVSDPNENLKNISNSFEDGLASFPFPNWNMTITGVEKFPFFGQFASSVTIENNFESEYSKTYSVNNADIEIPSIQVVKQTFSPLFGMNITFKEAFSGNLTASFKINTAKTLTLVPSSNLIQSSKTSDWSISASFSKAGFEIPFFGLSLQNDIAFSLSVSKTANEPIDYRFNPGEEISDKLPGNGSSVFTINPSIQYSLSSKVQMQLFYKYIRTEPLNATFTTVPRTSNEGGLNIRISIQ